MGAAPSTDPPRTWALAWHDALYGPRGFYRVSAPAGHFSTSAQGIPGAGEVLAAAVVELAGRHGCTRVVDVGAGGGELLAHLRALDPALHLTGVDVVDRRSVDEEDRRGRDHGRHGDPVDAWLLSPGGAALPDELAGLTDTLVIAHEWLDVVPCPVVQRDDGIARVWREVAVAPDGTETLDAPVGGEELAWLQRWVPDHVDRAEVGLPRDRAAADLLGRIDTGVLLIVDYGHDRATRPVGGTLTGFRDGRQVHPVPDGSCDLTAHVALDSLVEHVTLVHQVHQCHVSTQRDALADLLPDAGAPVPLELARREPTAYLQALARRAALHALCAPGGLGDFAWVTVLRPGDGAVRQ